MVKYEDILNTYKNDDLKEICREFNFVGFSKKKKSELVELINLNVINLDFINKFIANLEPIALEQCKNLCDNGSNKIENNSEILYFTKYGFITIDIEKSTISMPDELIENFNKVYKKENEIEENSKIVQTIKIYCKALSELWGIVPLDKLAEVYNEQNDNKITINDVKKIIYVTNKNKNYVCNDNELYHESLLLNPKDIEKLKLHQKDKPFYMPNKEVLIRYADDNYFENTKEYDEFVEFANKVWDLNNFTNFGVVEKIRIMAQLDCTIQEIFQFLEMAKLDFKTQDDLKKFANIYSRLHYNSRLWENRGHTSNEMLEINGILMPKETTNIEKTQVKSKTKIGRNDPCPCGSGKKYKKCCGR